MKKEDPRVNVTRPDGRPEAYDIAPEPGSAGEDGNYTSTCALCQQTENHNKVYGKGQIFMCSPIDASDGQAHMICLNHLPDNVVIYDPATDTCRDKTGQNVWRET